jgi:transketolase C-terminal domain/subunit
MKSIREQFGQTLLELAQKNTKIVAISCTLKKNFMLIPIDKVVVI